VCDEVALLHGNQPSQQQLAGDAKAVRRSLGEGGSCAIISYGWQASFFLFLKQTRSQQQLAGDAKAVVDRRLAGQHRLCKQAVLLWKNDTEPLSGPPPVL